MKLSELVAEHGEPYVYQLLLSNGLNPNDSTNVSIDGDTLRFQELVRIDGEVITTPKGKPFKTRKTTRPLHTRGRRMDGE